MSLQNEIAAECRDRAERREAARSMAFCALETLEARREKFDCIQVSRDPCRQCGVRGDVGCEHRPAEQAQPFHADVRCGVRFANRWRAA